MASPYDCIMGKPVPRRLKEDLERTDRALQQSAPHLTDIERASMVFEAMKTNLDEKRRVLLSQYIVQQQINTNIEGKSPKDQAQAMLNMIEGSDNRQLADMLNVNGVHDLENKTLSGFVSNMFQEFSRRIVTPGVTRNRTLQRTVLDELFQKNTGDPTANLMARGWREQDKYVADTLKSLGARIDYDPDRQFITEHRASSIRDVEQDEWINFTTAQFDLGKMIDYDTGLPFSSATIRPIMKELYNTISSNGAYNINPGIRHRLPAWQRVDQTHFFKWKDKEAWERYNNRFGFGPDLWSAMVRYQDRQARNIALFRVLGPDWDSTAGYMRDIIRKNTDPQERARKVEQFDRAYEISTGRMGVPHNQIVAEVGAGMRNVIQSVLLGGSALLQLFIDPVLQHNARLMNGLSTMRQVPQFAQDLASLAIRGPKGHSAKLALRLGLTVQSLHHSIMGSMRGIGEFDGATWAKLIADTNFRLSGMTLITDVQQVSFGREFIINLTENLGKKYSSFSDTDLSATLKIYGIKENDWLRISKIAPTFDDRGVNYLDLIALTKNVDYEIGAKIFQMINKETEARAVQTRTVKGQRVLLRGTHPGSVEGEVWRLGTNLLAWPATFLWTQLGTRLLEPGVSNTNKAVRLAWLFIGMTLMGAQVEYVTSILRGFDPPSIDPSSPTGRKFWMKAVAKSGAGGMLGDWLFREHYNEWDFMSKFMGPGIGILAHAASIPIRAAQSAVTETEYNVGRDVVKLLKDVTPFSTLWYARAAINRLIFDQLQLMIDPRARESFRYKENRALKENDMPMWWKHGETLPQRPPDYLRAFE